MAFNNNAVYNAAFASALTNGGWITDPVQGDYAVTVNRAVAFATEVDSQIPLDGGMNQQKADLIQSICQGTLSGRSPTSVLTTDYLAIATAIAALYQQAALSLV